MLTMTLQVPEVTYKSWIHLQRKYENARDMDSIVSIKERDINHILEFKYRTQCEGNAR
jgi:hypothetical protein